MPDSPKVAIVAALEREISPLVKDWSINRKEHEGRWYKFFEKDNMVLVCGGIGPEAARRASEAIISLYHPELVISGGFAGALDPALQPGHTFTPRHVIDAGDGSRTDSGVGEGVLVSSADVADVEQKARLSAAYGAHAVDMEAAAVARGAQAHGVRFLACKVISDASDASIPPIARFVSADGRFHTVRFLAYVAMRPWLWARVMQLARDSTRSAVKLCDVLAGAGALGMSDSELPTLTR